MRKEGGVGNLGRRCEPQLELSHDTKATVHYSPTALGHPTSPYPGRNLNSHGPKIPSHCTQCCKTAAVSLGRSPGALIQPTEIFPLR